MTYRWVSEDRLYRSDVWKLYIDRKLSYSITYLGRTCVALGGGQMRWKAQDHTNVEGSNDIPEFHDLEEAKAWVLSIVTLEN